MDNVIFHDKNPAKFNHFFASLKNSHWAKTASEKTIDSLFESALQLEDFLNQNEKFSSKDSILENYPIISKNKPADLLLESIIKNQNLDDHLTLYSIEKFSLLFSKQEFSKVLDKIISEVQLRKLIFELTEEFPDVDLDFYMLNNFICDILKSSDIKLKVYNALKNQTLVYLKAVKHCDYIIKEALMDEMISCLDSQDDLRLWFTLMKHENLESILELSKLDSKFLKAIMKFFDKFANEIESNYDEELNIQYSHVNLDFEDFIKVFQVFLNDSCIGSIINDYLESKTLSDKNFCFWIDIKSCL